MEAIYVDEGNILGLDDDNFEITVARSELELAEQERAKLYLEVESLTDTPRFYWFTDAVEPVDFPVGGPSDFNPGEDEGTFTLVVNVGDQLGERPS